MPLFLLTTDRDPQQIASVDDEVARTRPGPAAIVSGPAAHPATDEVGTVATSPADIPISEAEPPRGRPVAFREARGSWQDVGFEAADHWEQMTDELRSRLVTDHLAALDVAEFKIATNGASASIITNNWVYSGSPRTYRVAGQLRDFIAVLGELGRD